MRLIAPPLASSNATVAETGPFTRLFPASRNSISPLVVRMNAHFCNVFQNVSASNAAWFAFAAINLTFAEAVRIVVLVGALFLGLMVVLVAIVVEGAVAVVMAGIAVVIPGLTLAIVADAALTPGLMPALAVVVFEAEAAFAGALAVEPVVAGRPGRLALCLWGVYRPR